MDNTIITIFFSIGILLIVYALSGWYKTRMQRRFLSRMVYEFLGDKGAKNLILVMGGTLVALSSYWYINPKPKDQSDVVTIKLNSTTDIGNFSPEFASEAGTILTELNEISSSRYDKSQIKSISFQNNYLDDIPNIVWSMDNLEEITIKGNKIENLPIEKLNNLKKLKTVVVGVNQFSIQNMQKYKTEAKFDIKEI